MKKYSLIILLASGFISCRSAGPVSFPLYNQVAPNYESGIRGMERVEDGLIVDSDEAQVFFYAAEKPENKKLPTVVVCPGGGYKVLAIEHEGKRAAEWLQKQGYNALLLKYRMPGGNRYVPLEDVQNAIEFCRNNTDKLNIDPHNIGVMGYSAGGHLAALSATKYTSPANRPDFTILFYPLITFENELTHEGSYLNMGGDEVGEILRTEFSPDKLATRQTPPSYIIFCMDDDIVDPKNGNLYHDALIANGVPVVLRTLPEGGHGWGFADLESDNMSIITKDIKKWIDELVAVNQR